MDAGPAVSAASPSMKKTNPLLKYTLQGEAAALDAAAVGQRPLLGSVCLTGQGTVICAPPNAGKTLITLALIVEAIEAGRIGGDDVFYVDADDTTQGVAEKVRLLDEYGAHLVAEGYRGFRAVLLSDALEEMIRDGSARGRFLVLDTFKKFTSLMSKTETSRFTEVVRRFVLAGGTLLCLAHTNKHPGRDGRNVFAGVSDIIDDLDCAWTVDGRDGPDGKRIAQLTNKKRRGDNPDAVAFAYSPEPGLSYPERLTTVHEVDAQGEGGDGNLDYQTDDEDILYSLAMHIHHGPNRGKMELVRGTAAHQSVSKQRVLKLLEAHTGEDPERHRWRKTVRARGLHAFELLGELPDPPA